MKFGLILFAIAVLLYPTSQFLWKIGMGQLGTMNSTGQLFSWHTFCRVITNPYLVGGTTLAVITMVFWFGAISNYNISYLYPFLGLSYIVLSVLAYFVLKEPISPVHWIGICIIVLGCFLINYEKAG